MHFAVSWTGSKFETDNKYVDWTNGFWSSGTEPAYLANDNKYERWHVNATFRQLRSLRVALRYTKDELTSDVGVGATVLGIAAGIAHGHGGHPAADWREHLDLQRPGGHRDLYAGAHLDAR